MMNIHFIHKDKIIRVINRDLPTIPQRGDVLSHSFIHNQQPEEGEEPKPNYIVKERYFTMDWISDFGLCEEVPVLVLFLKKE